MREEKSRSGGTSFCIRCGRRAEAKERVNPSATWWLCWKCSQDFCRAKPTELAEWHREALGKYTETKNKAYLKFAERFLKPCISKGRLKNLT